MSTEYLDINEYDNSDYNSILRSSNPSQPSPKMAGNNISDTNILDQSITGTGLTDLIKDTNKYQKRNESKILREMRRKSNTR